MKKLTLMKWKWIFPLFTLFTFLLISCNNDDLNLNTPEPENPAQSSDLIAGTGSIPSSEQDWKDIPVLTDVKQLGWQSSSSKKVYAQPSLLILPIPPVFNQGFYGTCGASSFAYAIAMVSKKASGMEYKNKDLYDEDARTYSVAFLHLMTNFQQGIPLDDVFKKGVRTPDLINTLTKSGIPTAADWPYSNVAKIFTPTFPTIEVQNKALFNGYKYSFFKIKNEQNINKQRIKEILNEGSPVLFSMTIPKLKKYFVFSEYLRSGKEIIGKKELMEDYTNPNFKEFVYHAMTIVGYDDSRSAFLVLNSWGNSWGGKNGAPDGCFWLKYDVFNNTEDTYGDPNPEVFNPFVYDICTIGIDSEKVANSSILYEYNGYRDYKNVKYSKDINSVLIKLDGILSPAIKIDQNGFIEYPATTVIPSQGTIEIEAYINKDSFYQDVYTSTSTESSSSFVSSTSNTSSAPLFTTLISTQSEKLVGQTPDLTIGAMELRILSDGSVRVRIAEKSFDQTVKEMQASPTSSATNLIVFQASNKLDFNSWNRIGLSMGSEGLKIMVNGVVSTFSCTIPLSINQIDTYKKQVKPFTIGYSTVRNDHWVFTVGSTTVSGTNKLYREGFTGYIKTFRTSNKQADWVISK